MKKSAISEARNRLRPLHLAAARIGYQDSVATEMYDRWKKKEILCNERCFFS